MIGLIGLDSKLPVLSLMKISSFYKSHGEQVEFYQEGHKYDKVYMSVLFSWNREKAISFANLIKSPLEIGGSGWDLQKDLPPEIEAMKPDYDLYTPERIYKMIKGGIRTKEKSMEKAKEIANMGIGFSSRGCIRNCKFCKIPIKEGKFRQCSPIQDLINPRSNILTLLDNNLTADPLCIDKLHEIRDRKITLDLSQGLDIRLITEEKALALSQVKHLRSLHFAWDLMESEQEILRGIKILTKYIKPYRLMSYILMGFNTTFEEDMYRVQKLHSLGITPYAMKYDNISEPRLNHFARWVTGKFYKIVPFSKYEPWIKARENTLQLTIDDMICGQAIA